MSSNNSYRGLRQSSGWSDEPSQPKNGKRYIPPPDKIRKWAMESNEGGRAKCALCGESFAMYYIRLCKITAFRTDHVCNDCRKARNLTVAK